MKKLLTVLFLTLATIAKSQDTIKIPTPVARQIAKDLVSYDSLKAVHKLIEEKSSLLELKVSLQDSVISSYKDKCIIYDTMLVNEKQKFTVQGEWVKDLRKENKKLKVKLVYTKITFSAVICFLGYLLIK